MKYVRGETLETIIEKLADGDPAYHQRFIVEHRVQIFVGILDAVAFAHDRGYLHRDIKPSNVMVGGFGEVVLMDWGIAQRIGETPATHDGTLVGTPAYMSPEQARGETDLDARSDIYSLCVLFWELLTLQHPHADKTTVPELLRSVIEDPIPLASFPPKRHPHQSYVPMDLTHFLRAGLHKDRAQRYASVKAMIARLERRADGDIPIECHMTLVKRVSLGWMRFADRHPRIITFTMLFLVLAVIALGVLAIVR
jgi:serine/threonine-protein kinase